jgi:hypothetical protein
MYHTSIKLPDGHRDAAEIMRKMRYGKPKGARQFVAVPISTYQELTDAQKEEIRRFDPFLRMFGQEGGESVYIFWLNDSQLRVIENASNCA